MQCPSCGRETSDQASFCPYCGAGLSVPPPAAVPARRRRGVACCLGAFVLTILLLALLVVAWWFVGRRLVTNRLIDSLSVPLGQNMDLSSLRGRSINITLEEEIVNEQLGQVLPDRVGPVHSLELEFSDQGLELRFRFYRLWNTIEARLEDEQGEVRISGVEMSTPLRWILVPDLIAAYVEDTVNAELERNDLLLEELEVSSKGLQLTLEPRR